MKNKLGIDIGSRFVKIAYKTNDKFTLEIEDTIDFYKNIDKFKNKFKIFDVIATGYGRYNLDFLNATVISEIIAHSKGAIEILKLSNFTILDIGGQDTKVIKIKNRAISDFTTNDKCAASSGRFLENMANILKISLKNLLEFKEDPIKISSTCAVFTESEVIGAISKGIPLKKVAAGINYALFLRIKPWIIEQKSKILVLSGGIANSPALYHFIKEEFSDIKIVIPEKPQFLGAIGCYFK